MPHDVHGSYEKIAMMVMQLPDLTAGLPRAPTAADLVPPKSPAGGKSQTVAPVTPEATTTHASLLWQRAGDALIAKAEQRARERKCSLGAAFRDVCREHPALAESYQTKQI
jgi:hypothetical protein